MNLQAARPSGRGFGKFGASPLAMLDGGDVNVNGPGPDVMRLPVFWVMLLLVACSDSTLPDDPVSRAMRLHAGGDPEAALNALRDAMRESPDDPEVRLLLAEVYLDLDKGALAETALDQALDRGLPPALAVFPRARALFAEERFLDIIELPLPQDLSVGDLARTSFLKAGARARRKPSSDDFDDDVTKDYIELFGLVERYRNDPDVGEVAAQLAAARKDSEDVERAWQHFTCARTEVTAIAWLPLNRLSERVLRVGPDREFRTVAAAARAASDGDVVEIDPGTYEGGVALWPQNRLHVRGVGERPIITANGRAIEDRDVWLFTGDDIVVENVEISGARSPYENGAGIRHVGSGLTVRNVFLHDNENGLLTGNRHPESNTVLIEFSEFANNGDHRGYAHNIYVGRSKRFEMRYSYSRGSRGGHLVKSRASENLITYNRLTDEESGTSSYIIDVPEGGTATIIGNIIEQGAGTLNHGMISYGGEEIRHTDNQLLVINNSIYNRDFMGLGVRNHKDLDVVLANNLFGGAQVGTVEGEAKLIGNLTRPEHGMVDPRNYDFSLTAGAAAIDRGAAFEQVAKNEYLHPVRGRPRQKVWRIDVGAFERCGI